MPPIGAVGGEAAHAAARAIHNWCVAGLRRLQREVGRAAGRIEIKLRAASAGSLAQGVPMSWPARTQTLCTGRPRPLVALPTTLRRAATPLACPPVLEPFEALAAGAAIHARLQGVDLPATPRFYELRLTSRALGVRRPCGRPARIEWPARARTGSKRVLAGIGPLVRAGSLPEALPRRRQRPLVEVRGVGPCLAPALSPGRGPGRAMPTVATLGGACPPPPRRTAAARRHCRLVVAVGGLPGHRQRLRLDRDRQRGQSDRRDQHEIRWPSVGR